MRGDGMEVTYRNNKIANICTNFGAAKKAYNINMAAKIHQRIRELENADSVEFMIKFKIGRCHPLIGNRNGQFAVDLVHPFRLVFTKHGEEIQIAEVIEITDYH